MLAQQILAPATSAVDVLLVLTLSVPLALILHLLQGLSSSRTISAASPIIPDPSVETAAPSPAKVARSIFTRRYWSTSSIFLTWFPCLVMAVGNISCSLLRDAGYQIFPWPITSVSVLFGLTLVICQGIRRRIEKRDLAIV